MRTGNCDAPKKKSEECENFNDSLDLLCCTLLLTSLTIQFVLVLCLLRKGIGTKNSNKNETAFKMKSCITPRQEILKFEIRPENGEDDMMAQR